MSCSIIICTYNGKNRLERSLEHVLSQVYDLPYEVLLIDNASTDGTSEWVGDWLLTQSTDVSVRIIHERNPGLSNARLRGIKESVYPIILFCDDDNWLSSDYLQKGTSLMKLNQKIGVLGGCGKAEFESEKPDWFDQYSHSYAVGSSGRKSGVQKQGSWVYGAGCFFRKEAFLKLFDTGWISLLSDRKGNSLTSGGDVELCYAVQLIGYEIWFEPILTFKHWIESRRLTWDYYLRLKEGIASSFPLLQVYEVLFSRRPDLVNFRQIVRNRFFKGSLVFFKQYILNFFDPSPERELALKINYAIVKGYLNNRNKAIKGFKSLEKLTFP